MKRGGTKVCDVLFVGCVRVVILGIVSSWGARRCRDGKEEERERKVMKLSDSEGRSHYAALYKNKLFVAAI